ncbi:MAG: translation initiation factor IF-2 [Candidatus Palauibacterales bacterium]|nr:translation initiation factor IF-2 [Candidatus Palauibacterales bacterium]MDP2530508.1 translation initiation factor IF-2 [Candidatus Palauibacterales bacterium]MDP2582933.1 translation initiation factor IF-2 [Candidatus Palauibacterales bacterium]
MAKYRIYEVADELGAESSQLIQMLREMGVPVRSHMSTIDDDQVARLHARLERERRAGNGASSAEAESGGRRRRRRRRRRPEKVTATPGSEEEAELSEAEAEEEVSDEALEEELLSEAVEEPEAVEAAEEEEADAVEAETAELAEPEVEIEIVAEEEAAEEAEGIAAVAEVEVEEEEGVEEGQGEEPAEAAAEPEGEETEESAPKKKRKPRPVRRGLSHRHGPAASAAPGGSVKIEEGYGSGGRRGRRGRRKKPRVDQDVVQENVKKTLAALEGGSGGGGRRRRRDTGPAESEVEREKLEQEREAEKTRVRVNEFLTVAELADLIDASAQEIITSAFKNLGLMVTINQRLDFDQIELICEEFGYEAVREEAYEADLPELEEEEEEIDEEDLRPRAPVVTVMGHVDHGKTSLLDYIRKANVVAGESGGITQHIGAYRVDLDGGRSLTFLDTPGHEAFTAMRARGADLTDVVILVVAADDAVMPQTVEAISHAKNAGVPLVVAINKIDLPSADVARVKQDLLSHEVVLEDFGGDVLSAEVSAKTGEGVEDLLEKVLLQSELLELKADPERAARGTVVEAELDRGMGPVATVLVQSGSLRVGDDFLCGLHAGRVRALLDERGNNVESAGPATPVRVLGLEAVPQAGDSLVALGADRAREIATRRQQLEREKDIRRRAKGTRLEDVFEQIQAGEQAMLNLVIKGDTDGSVQALSDSLERLSTDEVAVEVIHRGVGAINESDVLLATTSDATILGFHVRPDNKARSVAESEGVEIRTYDVIYEAVQDVRDALEGMLEPEEREIVVGSAEVRQLFRVPKVGTVAGCYVSTGQIQRNLPLRLLRDGVVVYEGSMDSLKRFKDDVREVREGYECGLSIAGYNDVKVGDVIECYRVEEIARTLSQSAAS